MWFSYYMVTRSKKYWGFKGNFIVLFFSHSHICWHRSICCTCETFSYMRAVLESLSKVLKVLFLFLNECGWTKLPTDHERLKLWLTVGPRGLILSCPHLVAQGLNTEVVSFNPTTKCCTMKMGTNNDVLSCWKENVKWRRRSHRARGDEIAFDWDDALMRMNRYIILSSGKLSHSISRLTCWYRNLLLCMAAQRWLMPVICCHRHRKD